MSAQNRRASFTTSTASSLAKRHATSSENSGKGAAPPPHLAKKRVPLNNLTNQRNVADVNCKTALPHSALPISGIKLTTTKKAPSTTSTGSNSKSSVLVPCRNVSVRRTEEVVQSVVSSSPARSDDHSESMDETMLSPNVEYIDKDDVSAVDSINRKTFSNLFISDHVHKTVSICNRDAAMEDMDTDVEMADIDDNDMDPQLCATIACDIYKHLRASEMKKRPSTDFMEKMQKDINPSMRAILIDWLVEVAEEYRLVPDTLYLTINYIDRYLSGNSMTRQRLQLLGVASMMIAAKYEEICAPQVEEFCYITDNTYFKDEVLEMESAVLNFLKFELTAPTAKCFLRRFVTAAAKAANPNEVSPMQLECLANYIAELSLLEYSMLGYAPSLIAASAIFLAKYILTPSKRPWDSTLQHYTRYQPSDLISCVKDLHRLCLHSHTSSLPAVREKYSQHKYKYVAKKYCPPSIPHEFFHNNS